MTDGDREKPFLTKPPDPGLVKLVEALAREQARRDHRADLAARQQPKDRTDNGNPPGHTTNLDKTDRSRR